jgi:hydroxypyruvate isomerase
MYTDAPFLERFDAAAQEWLPGKCEGFLRDDG